MKDPKLKDKLRPAKPTQKVTQAELVALIDKVSILIEKSPHKAATILTSWANQTGGTHKSSSKKDAA